MIVRTAAEALLVRPSLLNDVVRYARDLWRLHRRSTVTELVPATPAALLLVAALRLRLRTHARHTRARSSLRLHHVEYCVLNALEASFDRGSLAVIDLHLIRARGSAVRR